MSYTKPKKPLAIWRKAFPKQAKALRPEKPAKRRYIRAMTPARSKEHRQYLKQRRVFLAKNRVCLVCNREPSTEVHHRAGRGPFLLVETTWLPVSSKCHLKIHRKPAWSTEKGFMLFRGGDHAHKLLEQWNRQGEA